MAYRTLGLASESRLTIGLAGLHFPVMGAMEHGIFETAIDLVNRIVESEHCGVVLWPELLSTTEDAVKAARYFGEQGIDFLLVQASSLAMGDTIAPLVEHFDRLGVWVVDEPTYSGELPLNSLTGYNLCVSRIRELYGESKKLKWFWGTGTDFEARLATTIRSLSALKSLRGSRIASIGGVVPTFDNLEYRRGTFEESLGIEIVEVPLGRLFQAAENAPPAAIESIHATLASQARCIRVGTDLVTDTARICYGLQSIQRDERVDACALRCWPEFQEWKGIAPCAAVAWSNDHCMPAACEGDTPGAVAMLLGAILSGTAATMNDPVALDRKTATVQMWHCGPGPASWADAEGQCLDYHHTLNRRSEPGSPLAGVSSDIRFAQGPVTMLRIRAGGDSLFVLEGEVVSGPSAPYPGSGGWIGKLRMSGKPVSLEDLLQMMAEYGLEHHYPVMRGHHGSVLAEMAAWAGWKILPRIDSTEHVLA